MYEIHEGGPINSDARTSSDAGEVAQFWQTIGSRTLADYAPFVSQENLTAPQCADLIRLMRETFAYTVQHWSPKDCYFCAEAMHTFLSENRHLIPEQASVYWVELVSKIYGDHNWIEVDLLGTNQWRGNLILDPTGLAPVGEALEEYTPYFGHKLAAPPHLKEVYQAEANLMVRNLDGHLHRVTNKWWRS